MKKNESIPANAEAMLASLEGVEDWLHQDKNNRALVFLSDGKDYTFLLVNSMEIHTDITFALKDDVRAMNRFLAIAESAEISNDFFCDDPEYKSDYLKVWEEESMGVDEEKDQLRMIGPIDL